VSLGYNLWWKEFDNSNFNTASYSTTSGAAQMVLGVPITETDTVTALLGIDSNQIFTSPGSTPQVIVDYIDALGQRTFHSWRGQIGWARNSVDNTFTPSRGMYQRVGVEVALPGSTVEYYKLTYDISKYWPLSRHLILNTRAELGYGDSYGNAFTRDVCFIAPTQAIPNPVPTPQNSCTPTSPDYVRTITADGLPFFENFYAGGVRSVRGFTDNTLGPRAAPFTGSSFTQPIGGALKTVGSVEMFFPTLLNTPAARISAFVDFGNVYADTAAFDVGDLRASTGLSLMWRSPMGPISISYALPLRKQDLDRVERLQFTFGGSF